MSISVPTNCANPDCREPSIKLIHRMTQAFAIDAVDGLPVFAHHITYRCSRCGHTWSVRGYSADENLPKLRTQEAAGMLGVPATRRGWRGWMGLLPGLRERI